MNNKEKNLCDEKTLNEDENKKKQENQQQKENQQEVIETIKTVDPRDERIKELESLLNYERDSLLRAKAEIENIRRRSNQDIEKAHKFALENFTIELLPVIDNLERAFSILDKNNNELKSTIEGIELTLKSLLDTVHKFGVDVIEEIHVPFNPEIHQAMAILESDDYASNTVMMVMQKGYTLNGRLIRPAMVTVSKSHN